MSDPKGKVTVVVEDGSVSSANLEDQEEVEKQKPTSSWIRKASELLGGDRIEPIDDESRQVQEVSLHKTSNNPEVNSQGDQKESESRLKPKEQNPGQAPKDDLRQSLLSDHPAQAPSDKSGSKCGYLSWLKCDDEACNWGDFLKCGKQWEKKPALKYVRLLCVAVPAIAMIALQVVNSAQGNSLTKTWCLRPRDKDGLGPLFVNIFFYWGWGDAMGMTVIYCIIAASVMIRGNRVFLISCLWIIISSGLFYWGLAFGSDCQAGASTLNLGLAFFNITQALLEVWWKIDINYYALGASLVTFITYLALLFKNVIPDKHTSVWAHLFSSIAGVVVSIAYAWQRHRSMRKAKEGGTEIA